MESASVNREVNRRISRSTIKKGALVFAIAVLGLILIAQASHAQPAPSDVDDTIDGKIREEIIDVVR